MALSGRLDADFASFYEACQRAVVELKGFDTETKTVEKSLNRMVEDFSGKQVQAQAALMIEAVERIGGASKLTEDELQKVASTAQAAAEKLTAMGQDVPEGIARFAKEAKTAEGATSSWSTALSSMTGVLGAFGIRLAADTFIGFVKGAVSSAAALGDLSVVTGIATDDLQRLGYVGKEFGATTDEIGKGVFALNQKLQAGSRVFTDLGLSVDALKAAGPTEAFLQFADAASRLEDPMQRNVIVSEALGDKLARQLIPGLADLGTKMKNVPQDVLISEETIRSANEFEAAMGRMLQRAESLALKGIMFAGAAIEKFGKQAEGVSGPMDTVNFTKYLDGFSNLESRVTASTAAMTGLTGATTNYITPAGVLENRLKTLREEALEPLTASQKATILELDDFGQTHAEIAPLVDASEAAVRRFLEADRAAAEVAKEDAANIKAAMKDLADFRDHAHLRQLEIMQAEQKAALAKAAQINTEVEAELAAQARMNAKYDTDVAGNLKVASAIDIYRQKLEALHKTKEDGFSQAKREQELLTEYNDGSLKEAQAVDAATAAFWKARDAVKAKGDAVETATKQTGVYMNQLHMLVNDPKLAAFFGNSAQGATANTLYSGGQAGITPEMAAAMAGGQFIQMAGVGAVGSQKRAAGGPVTSGQPYLVGEKGPELFVPTQSGAIVANGTSTGSSIGGTTINIHITQPLGTPDAIARAVGDALTTRSRALGQRL